jgi:competence CoiA-like predicted nuclease
MLTALLYGEKVISTDERYEECKEEFRRICNANAVCPICRESIICKFGPIMIHHFAHRHNSDCPGNHETIEHMLGKKLLYDFLHDRYGDKGKVELEESELRAIIEKTIEELQATGPGDIGRVMKQLMPGLKGRADGKLVKQIVDQVLQ